jgi:hypothetical protein
MRKVKIGNILKVSGLCIGGNPFSGFSHQTSERSKEMTTYYTPDQIKKTLRIAETAGINTLFARTDDHILGIIKDYWDTGGTIQWFAQVCVEQGEPDAWKRWLKDSVKLGARAAYIHGGVVDNWYASKKFDTFREALDMMRERNIAAGFAGHNPEAHEWIRDNLDVDFQMCCYYNPTDRSKSPHHIDKGEKWDNEDRKRILEVIATIQKPVVHYKVFAGGNKPITQAFEVMGKHIRNSDVACVGFFLKDDPDMIRKDIDLFEKYVDKV